MNSSQSRQKLVVQDALQLDCLVLDDDRPPLLLRLVEDADAALLVPLLVDPRRLDAADELQLLVQEGKSPVAVADLCNDGIAL